MAAEGSRGPRSPRGRASGNSGAPREGMRRMKMFPAAGMRGRRAVLGKVRGMGVKRGERRKVKRGWRRKGERREIVMRMKMGVRRKGFA